VRSGNYPIRRCKYPPLSFDTDALFSCTLLSVLVLRGMNDSRTDAK
jgi:hypothetical protein